MANLYLDFTGGNDSNNATTFALRCKTITSGITAARHTPGDTIRIMKSEDPVSLGVDATFTNYSSTVTLASALTTNIYATAGGAWTASANVTCTTSTTRKSTTSCAQHAIASGFATGKVAYFATGTLDLSGYTKISLWMRCSAAVASGVFSVRLCSDATGTTSVNSFTINEAFTTTNWRVITLDNGSALDSSIGSVALYAISDPGTVTVLMDNIIACNDLTLTSVISLDSSATSLDFWPIREINGTTIKLDEGLNSDGSTSAKGYVGTTATSTIYKIEPVVPSNQFNTIQEAGSSQFVPSTYSGGWDTTDMSTQTGLTFMRVGDASGDGITSGHQFTNFENLIIVGGRIGFTISASKISHKNCAAIRCNTIGFSANQSYNYYENCRAACCTTTGWTVTNILSSFLNCYALSNRTIGFNITFGQNIFYNITSSNNASDGFLLTGGDNKMNNIIVKNNGGYGISVYGSAVATAKINGLISSTNSSNVIRAGSGSNGGSVEILNATCSEVTPFTTEPNFGLITVGGTGNQQKQIYRGGSTATSIIDTSNPHSPATKSITHSNSDVNYYGFEQIQVIDRIQTTASGVLTFSVWVKRTTTTVGAKLVLRAGQCTGITTEQSHTASASANTWEQLTVSGSPGEIASIQFELVTWKITSSVGTVYWSDFTCSQA